jgi:CRISPR-associated endonuclease Csn1
VDIRKASAYNIGLDLGTGSVGWAVTDTDGELLHYKGDPTWGSRLFDEGNPASKARKNRGQRRRYVRRRWRLNLLQSFFEKEIEKVDPEFFIRLDQSRLLPEDRKQGHSDYRWPLFNDSDFDERAYYQKFPTIYHLRAWLMETSEKADIRLVYLAFHNIVKTRGNFLHQDNPSLSAKNADADASVEHLTSALTTWFENNGTECTFNESNFTDALTREGMKRADRKDALVKEIKISNPDMSTAELNALKKIISGAVTGYKVKFPKLFFLDGTESFELSNDEKVEEFYGMLPDDGIDLFDALREVYSAFVLAGILNGSDSSPITSGALKNASGATISFCKVREYLAYKEDLKTLKALVRDYAPDSYSDFFRGPTYKGTKTYDAGKAKGYTKYDSVHKSSYDEFKKSVVKLFEGTQATDDPRYLEMMDAFEEERFLRRLKTSDNGSIPYQLHLEEMDAIIENQKKFYPFLGEHKKEIESLVSFRIPYYVGPLSHKNAAKETVQGTERERFAWSVRKPGMEDATIYPWNWDKVIDKHLSAQRFIERMTKSCTYLIDEPVLPKCSLLYEEFCVLNELNGSRFSLDGDKFYRFDYADRTGIFNDLFKHKKTVSYEAVENWLRENHGYSQVRVARGQGEKGYESKLSSYFFFCHDIFDMDELPESYYPMIEEIILWNTLFEDREILRDEIKGTYGDVLNDQQIKRICKKRFAGWGRLSKELLCGIKADTDNGKKSIMDILREGDPNSGARSKTMILMEILHDEKLDFQDIIEKRNKEKLPAPGELGVNDLPGSPAIRRTVNQATRIVEEIVDIAGKAPDNIFIETTRDEEMGNKGKRTKTRLNNLKNAYSALKSQSETFWDGQVGEELKKDNALDDDRVFLYFSQMGKCMYSMEPLDFNRLSEYQVDHIIPQAYIKDDSLENKVLVKARENQRKKDDLSISPEVRNRMKGFWTALHNAKLIGDKKFRNLMNNGFSEGQLRGFINRQLVETSQIVKLTRTMLENRLPNVNVLSVKASLSHSLREAAGFPKSRVANNYHHAHDALLAAEIGRFMLEWHSEAYENVVGYTKVFRSNVEKMIRENRMTNNAFGSSGYFINSFCSDKTNKETGEFWDAHKEIEKIRRSLGYKQCHITRMPYEDKGAYWDSTIYSPHAANGDIPIKRNLDPSKYGNFSREQFAYFYIYEAKDNKGRRKLFFDNVPVSVATKVSATPEALEQYARTRVEKGGMQFERIARRKILKYQLIEVGGNQFYLTGQKEVRNAREIAFSQQEMKIIAALSDDSVSLSSQVLTALYEILIDRIDTCAPKLASLLKLDSRKENFTALNEEEQRSLLQSILLISSAQTNTIDLSPIGESKRAGTIQPTFNKMLASEDGITFIDQSVTGMREKRTRIGL